MTLGELIDTLEPLPAEMRVRFDSGHVLTRLMSWRGVYAELTLDSTGGDGTATVGGLLEDARKADGGTFEGYKGGEFKMSRSTPVWADPWGEYQCRGIMGTKVEDGSLVLLTADLSDYR